MPCKCRVMLYRQLGWGSFLLCSSGWYQRSPKFRSTYMLSFTNLLRCTVSFEHYNRCVSFSTLHTPSSCLITMAPHWTSRELHCMRLWHNQSPQEVLDRLKRQRDRAGIATPNIKQVRKVMTGKTFRLGAGLRRPLHLQKIPPAVELRNCLRLLSFY